MGTTANQIESDIERQRETLGSNIQELEHKVKTATDWRHHYRNHPLPMIGVAFGGGLLLSAMVSGRKRAGTIPPDMPPRAYSSGAETHRGKTSETWDNVKGALIGVAATQLKEYVNQLLPGFREHYERNQQQRKHGQSLSSSDWNPQRNI